jgi:hypothetical protein
MPNSYQETLEAAGAEVLAFGEFGSYQGDWLAKVRYKGAVRFLKGSYGSCSGCDSLQAEFGYNDEVCSDHRWEDKNPNCQACKTAKAEYDAKVVRFGQGYLDDSSDPKVLLEEFTKQAEWDHDAKEILKWLKTNAEVG